MTFTAKQEAEIVDAAYRARRHFGPAKAWRTGGAQLSDQKATQLLPPNPYRLWVQIQLPTGAVCYYGPSAAILGDPTKSQSGFQLPQGGGFVNMDEIGVGPIYLVADANTAVFPVTLTYAEGDSDLPWPPPAGE